MKILQLLSTPLALYTSLKADINQSDYIHPMLEALLIVILAILVVLLSLCKIASFFWKLLTYPLWIRL